MSKFFNIKSLSNEIDNDTEFIATNFIDTHLHKLKHINDLTRLPSENEAFDIFTLQSFNAFTLILWVLQFSKIKKLHVSTYSMSRDVSQGLIRLFNEGKIQEFNLIISDSMINRNPIVIDTLKSFSSENFKINFTWNHTKISLIELNSGEKISITCSGNFSKNAQYENYIIRNSNTVYDFYKDCFDSLNFDI